MTQLLHPVCSSKLWTALQAWAHADVSSNFLHQFHPLQFASMERGFSITSFWPGHWYVMHVHGQEGHLADIKQSCSLAVMHGARLFTPQGGLKLECRCCGHIAAE